MYSTWWNGFQFDSIMIFKDLIDCLIFIGMTIADNIWTLLLYENNILKYLKVIKDQFKSVDKSLTDTLIKELVTTQYDDTQGI